MADQRRGGVPTACAILLSLACASAGCSNTSKTGLLSASKKPAPSPEASDPSGVRLRPPEPVAKAGQSLLQPRTEVAWRIDADPTPAGGPLAGQSIVGPDGTLVLGPYGTYRVQGMTAAQASGQIEKQLAAYLQRPRVSLTPTASAITPTAFNESPSGVQPAAVTTVTLRPSPDWLGGGPVLEGPRSAPLATSNEQAPQPRLLLKEEERHADPVVLEPGYAAGQGAQFVPPVYHGGAPNETHKVTLPTYVISPPDILQIDSLLGLLTQPIRGAHLVRPDGTVGIGAYGDVYVAGLTLQQAREQIARAIFPRLKQSTEEEIPRLKQKNKQLKPNEKEYALPPVPTLKDVYDGLSVDVLAYNSKVYYVITDRVGFGELVERLPITGNETVLDAISQVRGLPPEASRKNIWVARVSADGKHESKLPVDWKGITQNGNATTNYQLLPGDRVYVRADCWRTADNVIAKVLSPFERLLGITLLGSQTVNSIKNGRTGGL